MAEFALNIRPPVDMSEDALRIKPGHLKMLFLPEASNEDVVWDNQLRMLLRAFDQLKVKNIQLLVDRKTRTNRLLVFLCASEEGRPDEASFNLFVKDPIMVWRHRMEVNDERRQRTKSWDAYDPLRCATVFFYNNELFVGALPCVSAKRFDNGDIQLEFTYETHVLWRE